MLTRLRVIPLVKLILKNKRVTHLLDPEKASMETVNTTFGVDSVETMDTPLVNVGNARL